MSYEKLSKVFDVTASTLQEEKFSASATSAATELANRLPCDRVSIGFRKNNQTFIQALSHSPNPDKQMNLARALCEAMDESLDQKTTIGYPEKDETQLIVHRAHDNLANVGSARSIVTVPFVNAEGEGYGAVCFERMSTDQFTEDETKLCQASASILGPILREKQLNDRTLHQKAFESFETQLVKFFGPGYPVRKFVLSVLAVFIIIFSLVNGDFRVTAPATLEGVVQRVVIAPYDGYVAESNHRSGETVDKGQIIARMDVRDLVLERMKWSSQQKQYGLEYHQAMAENKIAEAQILQEQMNQAESQLALIDEQVLRAKISAPFKGLIVTGDLSQSIGAPVERGQVLFEVAPLDSYRIMLEVDEKDVSYISGGQQGKLVLNALPGMELPIVVENITAVSAASEGKNFFMVQAGLQEKSDRLRPGMQGYAKISVGQKKIIWIWTHELVDWLRLWFWSVIP